MTKLTMMPNWRGRPIIADAVYGAGEIAHALEDGAFILCGREYTRQQVESLAAEEPPHLGHAACVHAPRDYAQAGLIELARRILAALPDRETINGRRDDKDLDAVPYGC